MLCEFGINKLNTQITEQITCAFGLVCICFLAIYFRLVLWLIQILRLGFSSVAAWPISHVERKCV